MNTVRLKVEFIPQVRESVFAVMSRVPCVGELVYFEDSVHEVLQVFHPMEPGPGDRNPVIVRVRA